mgnify:CR=1 FL=1
MSRLKPPSEKSRTRITVIIPSKLNSKVELCCVLEKKRKNLVIIEALETHLKTKGRILRSKMQEALK